MTFYLIKFDSTQKSCRALKSISIAAFINLKIMRLYKRLCKTLLEKRWEIIHWNQIYTNRDKSHELSSSILILKITTAGQTGQKPENPMTTVLQICMNVRIGLKQEATGRVYDVLQFEHVCGEEKSLMWLYHSSSPRGAQQPRVCPACQTHH